MKLKLFTLFFIAILMTSTVNAGLLPYAVSGEIKSSGVPLGSTLVTVNNLDAGTTSVTTTNVEGFYILTLSDWYNGHRVQVTACDVNVNSQCVRTKVIGTDCPAGGGCEIDFAIGEAQVKECPDGSVILLENDCPVEEEPEVVLDDIKVVGGDNTAGFDVGYGREFDIEVQENKLDKLKDGEIKHEGEEYNIHEVITFTGEVLTSIDNEDYIVPRLTIPKEGIKYTYVFDDPVPFDEIDEDNELTIIFAGKELVISDVDDSRFKIKYGKEDTLAIDECNGDVCVVQIGDDAVRVSVDGVLEDIEEGSTETVGDTEIFVSRVWSDEPREATILFGDDVVRSITNGDGYADEDDEDWTYEYVIADSELVSISLTNKNDYTDIDDNRGFFPLKEGQEIALPNDFAAVRFESIPDYDLLELEFEVDEDMLYVTGDFEIDNEDYDELYIDNNGFYDADFELLTTDDVRIGDTDTFMELGSVIIGELKILMDMSDILHNGVSMFNKEEVYMDHSGLVFENPEQAIDDSEGFIVSVPDTDDDIEVSISITKVTDKVDEEIKDDDEVIITPPVEPPVQPPITPPIQPPVITPPVEPPVVTPDPIDPDETSIFDNLVALLAILLAAIGVTWRAGYLGLCKYYWKKGEKKRALKMLFTATKRAKEDYYRNKGR